jgi:hypothetical protein
MVLKKWLPACSVCSYYKKYTDFEKNSLCSLYEDNYFNECCHHTWRRNDEFTYKNFLEFHVLPFKKHFKNLTMAQMVKYIAQVWGFETEVGLQYLDMMYIRNNIRTLTEKGYFKIKRIKNSYFYTLLSEEEREQNKTKTIDTDVLNEFLEKNLEKNIR